MRQAEIYFVVLTSSHPHRQPELVMAALIVAKRLSRSDTRYLPFEHGCAGLSDDPGVSIDWDIGPSFGGQEGRLAELPTERGTEAGGSVSEIAGSSSLDTGRIAICLSGGGTRAAAFAAGVLDAIVERNLIDAVKCIASSSGGSIANAALGVDLAVARSRGLTKTEEQAYLSDELSGLTESLSKTRLSPYSRIARMRLMYILATIVSPVTIWYLRTRTPWQYSGTGTIAIVAMSLFVVYRQSKLGVASGPRDLERELRYGLCDVIFGAGDSEGESVFIDDISMSPIRHVFIATDLRSMKPVYIMAEGVVKDDVRRLDAPRLIDSVLDSMRFPGYLAPRLYPFGDDFLEMVDGGVVDNHATSWLTGGDRADNFDLVISVQADRGLRRGRGIRWSLGGRFRSIAETGQGIHALWTRHYLDQLHAEHPEIAIVRVVLPRHLYSRTSLARLGARSHQLFEVGRQLMLDELAR